MTQNLESYRIEDRMKRLERERDALRQENERLEEERDRLAAILHQEAERRARAEAERDEIKADYHNIIRKANTAEWERDEARAALKVARDFHAEWHEAASDYARQLEQAREALKVAHHALTTVHGLWATDLLDEEWGHAFQIDTLTALKRTLEAMGDGMGAEEAGG